jgi:hypothetical protein
MSMPHMPPVNMIRQLLVFEPYVPRRLRFWLVVMMALFYQFVGGVYLASLSQMVGELGVLSEDVNMGSYCSLIGLNIIFPMMFRWKFGLYSRQMFFLPSCAIIVCSVLACYVTSPVAFWIICFFAGYFKMMGMFSCMSTIQLNITPTRDFAVFFPVIYVIVCGAIQLSGLVTAYVTYFTNWRMMNLVVMAMMLIIDFIVYFFMRHDHRSGPYIPLKGIDWVGQILWTLLCVCAAWIFTFGEHYDWWDSVEIWRGTFVFLFLLVTTLLYSHFKKDTYIPLKAFTYSATWSLIVLLMAIAVLHGSAHVLQPIFLANVLGYDNLNIISLNYPELAGIIMGAILAYFILIRWRYTIKYYLMLTFIFVGYYVLSLYYMCDNQTDKETLYLAMFALGVSEVMMETVTTYYLSQKIPFKHFFMNIAIVGFVRCGVGTAAGAAIVHRLFSWAQTKSFMIASESFTHDTPTGQFINDFSTDQVISLQSMMMALKECYGYMILLVIVVLLFILLSRYRTDIRRFVPRMMSIRRWMSHPTSPDPTTVK